MSTIDYAAAAQSSYEVALFYAETAIKRISYLSTQNKGIRYPLRECQTALRETISEMNSPMMKDDIYTASIRKWYNIVLYEKVNSDLRRQLQASEALEQAYKMRTQHEEAFLADNLDGCNPEFDASRRAFGYAVYKYDIETPVLGRS